MFWEKGDRSKLPSTQTGKIRLILTLLNSAKAVEDANLQGSDLHSLKGDFAGFWAVKVTGNYRIIFRFIKENALDVDYIDGFTLGKSPEYHTRAMAEYAAKL